jgi:phosphatidylserine/phosphatidylglycerophosphate/cardiolipin synthase-like enzyme
VFPEIRKRLQAQLEILPLAPTEEEGVAEAVDLDAVIRETIVVTTNRPILEVRAGDFFAREENEITPVWEKRLDNARIAIRRAIASVGRVELMGHPRHRWVGTAWLVADNIVVTNRHVAEEFARRRDDRYVFRPGFDRAFQSAKIDFREEFETPQSLEIQVVDVLYIEDADDPDIAFLRLASSPELTARPVPLENGRSTGKYLVAIGYPTRDDRIPNQALAEKLLGDIFGKKRVAPGELLHVDADVVRHDCSTFGGNSGSVLLDLDSGAATGLHYAGIYLEENLGVAAPVIRDRLERVHPDRRLFGGVNRQVPPYQDGGRADQQESDQFLYEHDSATWEIPLRITVQVGSQPQASLHVGPPTSDRRAPYSLQEAAAQLKQQLEGVPGVAGVRLGYLFRDGWITDEKAVVVLTKGSEALAQVRPRVPQRLGAFAVDVTPQTPWDVAEEILDRENAWQNPTITYTSPAGVPLEEIDDEVFMVCHVSPDAGWPTLEDFLNRTDQRLTLAMYEFTAPHVFEAVRDAVLSESQKLQIVYQKGEQSTIGSGTKVNDIKDDEVVDRLEEILGDRFKVAYPKLGPANGIFGTSYHIKVAVRDGETFWLSSGNWQSSNQPEVSPAADSSTSWSVLNTYNREWHVIVVHSELASVFETYIQHDYQLSKQAAFEEMPPIANILIPDFPPEPLPVREVTVRYFEPLEIRGRMRIQPLLTPDNYQEHVLDLIDRAEERILFQNQSFDLRNFNQPEFRALAEALLNKQRAGLDVYIILRGDFNPRPKLEKLKDFGFDMSKVKTQRRCHTKGIIVDGRSVLVGSHNWTNFGVLFNRDASLIIHNDRVAAYYENVFWFDWQNMATRQIVNTIPELALAGDREAAHVKGRCVPIYALDDLEI